MKQCNDCKKRFKNSELIAVGSQLYCNECVKPARHREQFQKYVCWLFGIKAPGPLLWSQRKTFMDKYKYTDRDICDTLKYIYEIKGQYRSPVTLGLVPSNYEEAKEYYEKLRKDQANFTQQLQHIIDNPPEVREIDLSKVEKILPQGGRKQIDLNSLFDD